MVNGLYLYRYFLVLMTTQGALQYSFFVITHSHTLIQCIYGEQVIFLRGAILWFSILPKDTLGKEMIKTGIEPLITLVRGRPLSHSCPKTQ